MKNVLLDRRTYECSYFSRIPPCSAERQPDPPAEPTYQHRAGRILHGVQKSTSTSTSTPLYSFSLVLKCNPLDFSVDGSYVYVSRHPRIENSRNTNFYSGRKKQSTHPHPRPHSRGPPGPNYPQGVDLTVAKGSLVAMNMIATTITGVEKSFRSIGRSH